MKYKKYILTYILPIAVLVFFGFTMARADWVSDPLGTVGAAVKSKFTIEQGIASIYNLIITISEVTFIIIFLVGGIMYLTSLGNEAQSEKAKKLLVDAVIGIVIVSAAWAVGSWIINNLQK